MQVIVKGRNFQVPPQLKELATRKLEKVRRYFDRIQTLEIEFSEEHNPRIADKFTVEVSLKTKAHLLRAHASGPDPASAVDLVLDKLESQVKRLKEKIVGRGRGRAGANSKAAVRSGPGAETEVEGVQDEPRRPIQSEEEQGTGEVGEPTSSSHP